MRTFLLIISILFLSVATNAQNGINYKALIKDANGNALVSQGILVQFQILESGTLNVYQETHDTITDANGIVVVNIGEGTVDSGNFLTVDWGSADHFLNVQVDSGDGFVDLGTTQFKSVPYAMMAETLKNPPLDISTFSMAKSYLGDTFSNAFNAIVVDFDEEVFDTTNNYDPTTNTFTVSQQGYYRIEAIANAKADSSNKYPIINFKIMKNGIIIKQSTYEAYRETSNYPTVTIEVSSVEFLEIGDEINISASATAFYTFFASYDSDKQKHSSFLIERIR